jgi:hypothetical protein
VLSRNQIKGHFETLATEMHMGHVKAEAFVALGCEVVATLQEAALAARIWRQAVILNAENPDNRMDS